MISGTKSRNSFVRKNATKIFTTRIIQGYQITSDKCTECLVPLMSYQDKTKCVVCDAWDDAHATGEVDGPEKSAANDLQLCRKSSHNVGGSVRSVSESLRRETRNDVNHHGKHRRVANSVILVTEDGVELSPGIGSVDSRNSAEIESYESDDSGCDGDDGAVPIEVSSRDGDHEEIISERERSETSNSQTNSALFLAALNKLARLPRQQEKKSTSLHGIVEEEHQSNTSYDVAAIDSVSILPARGDPQGANAPLARTGDETITVSVNTEIIHDIDSTLTCCSNGKALASQVIQNTDNILNNLESSKSKAHGVSENGSGTCVSPLTSNGNTGQHLDKLVTMCVLDDSESNLPKSISIAPPRINTPASPITRKRITINNLANGFASTTVNSATRPKQKTVVTNSLTSTVIDKYDAELTTSSGSANSFISDEGNELPEASRAKYGRDSNGDFFSELRHKALMAKATSYQKKLEADGYCTKRDALPTTGLTTNIEKEVKRDEDNVLECSSPDSPDTTVSIHLKDTRVESSIPDDEKKYIALKSVREEKVVKPFDENPRGQALSESIEASSSAALSLFAPVFCETDTESKSPSSTCLAKVQAITRLSDHEHHPSVESVSVISLSSTVNLQSNRIAQLEADALHKHQLAELAAASAREVLEEMIKARTERMDNEEGGINKNIPTRDVTPKVPSKSTGDSDQLFSSSTPSSERNAENKSSASIACEVFEQIMKAGKERRDNMVETRSKKSVLKRDMTPKVPSESTLVQDIGDSDQLSLCSTLSSERNAENKYTMVDSSAKNEINNQRGEDPTFASPYQDTDYSAASTSQYDAEKRALYPKTPKDESSLVSSRDSESSVTRSELSSSYSTAGDIDSRRYRSHDRSRLLRSSSATHSRTLDTKTNLFLPSLCTPDSISSRTSQQHSMQSIYRSHSASPRHRLRDKRSIPTSPHQSMKPNHLLSYSPRGDVKETRKMLMNRSSSSGEARLRSSMRPEPISAINFNEHHPSMPHHFSEVGLDLPRGQCAIPSRMANLKLAVDTNIASGLQHHSYGGRSLTPKSTHELNRYRFSSNDQMPSGYRHPPTRSIDTWSLAQNHDPMVSMNNGSISGQYLMGGTAPAQVPTIMTAYPHSYSKNATVLPPNPYGGRSITPKSFHEQKRYGFRSYEQQPFHDATHLAHPHPYHGWMNSRNQESIISRQLSMMPNDHSTAAMFADHYGSTSSLHPFHSPMPIEHSSAAMLAGHHGSISSRHPYNSPARVSFFDNFEEDKGDQPQFLSSAGGHGGELHNQPFQQQQQPPFVLY